MVIFSIHFIFNTFYVGVLACFFLLLFEYSSKKDSRNVILAYFKEVNFHPYTYFLHSLRKKSLVFLLFICLSLLGYYSYVNIVIFVIQHLL